MFDDNKSLMIDENGSTEKKSASDQTIIIRRFGMPIEFEVAGKKFTLKPGSYFFNSLLVDIVEEFRTDNQDIILKMKEFEEPEKQKKTKAEVLTERIVEFTTNLKLALSAQKESMFKAVRLILYDSKKPEWKAMRDSAPDDSELDTIITMKELERIATIEEINTVLDIYNQLNRPELPRQNFLELGKIM